MRFHVQADGFTPIVPFFITNWLLFVMNKDVPLIDIRVPNGSEESLSLAKMEKTLRSITSFADILDGWSFDGTSVP